MDAAREILFQKLRSNLEELTKIYSQLVDVVALERDLLLCANLEGLQLNNETKESLIMKARFADTVRIRIAEEVAAMVGADPKNPRLLDIAQKAGGAEALQLRDAHRRLERLINQLSGKNKENEEYTRSALKTLDGAMNDLKESVSGKKTYGGKGTYKLGPEKTGNFLSKEA